MKIFWTLILLLALGGAGMFWMRASGAPAAKASSPQGWPSGQDATQAPVAQSDRSAAGSQPASSSIDVVAPQPEARAEPADQDGGRNSNVSPGSSEAQSTLSPALSSAQAAPTPSEKPEPAASEHPQQLEVASPPQSPPPAVAPASTSQPPPTSSPMSVNTGATAQHTGVAPPSTEYKPSDRPAKPHSVVVQADGSTLVDERFKVTGDGSKEKPYVISWDLLVSASEEYSPRDGRTELPARIRMLDAKYVEITGHIAFPLLVEEPRELLSMLNQWDGCCIGVPPTPYDAVEVKLTKVVRGPDRLASYGIIRGKLKVEPQLVGKWLVALYAISDAELVPKGYGGFTP